MMMNMMGNAGQGMGNMPGPGMMNMGGAYGQSMMPVSTTAGNTFGLEGILGPLLSGVLTLAVWALVIAGVVFLIRGIWEAFGQKPLFAGSKQSFEILRQRYAKGEITRDEYETAKQALA